MMLGGRSAEMLQFKDSTVGAHSDIQNATIVARSMVVEFGMSELGPVNYSTDLSATEGKAPWEASDISPAMKEKVDKEVVKIISQAYKDAVSMLKKHRKDLDRIADALLEKETLDREQFEEIVGKKK